MNGLAGKPVCVLEHIVVDPAHWGRGFGTRVLQSVSAEADAAGWPILLTASEPRIVAFFKRVGFQVVAEAEKELAGVRFMSWIMLRWPTTRETKKER